MLKGFGDIQSDLTGKAQALVGQLLMARNQLNSLVNSSDANVASQAQVLLNTQTDLETQLSTVNAQLSSGASLSIPDYATIGVFLVKAQAQVDAVNALAGGTSAPMGLFTELGIGAGALVFIGFLIYLAASKGGR